MNHVSPVRAIIAITAAATPIPALAPVLSPDCVSLGVAKFAEPVAVEVEVEVKLEVEGVEVDGVEVEEIEVEEVELD